MRSTDENLFRREGLEDANARILVAQFNGAFDAGGASRLAVEEMLRSLPSERVATFDPDAFLDYRSHRPLATVQDWVVESMEAPELVLDRVKDDLGNPVLVLHGAEPDAKWESFARIVAGLAAEAGVEIVVSFHGVPSGVPHTRPTPVHVQATEKPLIPEQPQMAQTMRFPAPMTTFLQARLAERGIPGIMFLAAVPFYVADSGYPAGASALLGALSELADLSLPVGELEQDAAEELSTIERLLESNAEMQHTVSALEEHFDAWSGVGSVGVPLGDLGSRAPLGAERKTEKDIGDVIEAYLANLEESPAEASAADEEPVEAVDDGLDPLQAALRRVELRRSNPEAARRTGAPRHRAESSGEADHPDARSSPGGAPTARAAEEERGGGAGAAESPA